MLVSVWRRLKIDYRRSVGFLGFSPEMAIVLLTVMQPVGEPYPGFERSLHEGFGPARPLSAAWKKFNQAYEAAWRERGFDE